MPIRTIGSDRPENDVAGRGGAGYALAMPTAIVLLKVDHRKVTGTAEKLLDIPDVSEVFSISGRYDLLVIIKCATVDMIEAIVTDQLLRTEGITDSETMFAFRSYDKREGGRAIEVD